MSATPLVSIITSTYNAAAYLEASISSVTNQSYNNYEHIVIDGASIDGTIDIIKRHALKIKYWISEKDSGIYEAWNKGLKEAKGEWVLFLGADDELLPDALETYINFINNHSDKNYDYISSKVRRIKPDGSVESVVGKPWKWSQFKYRMTTAHPGSFHAKQLFSNFGNYNETYKIVSDYEILLRPGKQLKAGFIDKITVLMSTGTPMQKSDATIECLQMQKERGHLCKIQYLLHYYIVTGKFFLKELIFGKN